VVPRTGRTHQIRIHLAAIGHPLLVDPLYGNRSGWRMVDPKGGPAARLVRTPLHAAELTLRHPTTGERVTVRAPLFPDHRRALEVLRTAAGRSR
jgi:23S rRNA-/tRNA-specific pseudouridylate synthase